MVYIRKTVNSSLNFGAKKPKFEYAKKLRKTQTESEIQLWEELRSRKCAGLKFRRQHPVGHFIVDFYCHEYLLAIEVDGGIHRGKDVKERDVNRQLELEKSGILVIRFTDDQVLNHLSDVLDKIAGTVFQHRP